jgi:hypothetical protein
MRASKPSSHRRHNNLKDCQSTEANVADNMLAHKMVRSKQVVAKELETNNLVSNEMTKLNNVEIRGQAQLPDNFHDQLSDYFSRVGQPLRAPRLSVESANVQNMLCVKGQSNVQNLLADGCVNINGNLHVFGTTHFYGPVRIHGSFEVDQKEQKHRQTSLVEHMTHRTDVHEPMRVIDTTSLIATVLPVSDLSSISTFVRPPPEREIPKIQEHNIPVPIFQCRQLQADSIKAKDTLEVRQIQSQRAIVHTQESKEFTSQSIQTDTILVNDQLHANHLSADTTIVNSLEVKTKVVASSIETQQLQVASGEANIFKAKTLECTDKCTAMKMGTKQLDVTKLATMEDATIKKALNVHGLSTLDAAQCMGPLTTHDQVRHNASLILPDRMEAEVGRPIQMKQAVQFHRPICESNYQYVIFNTPQSSTTKPFQVTIDDSTNALIIDSDVMNIWSLDIRLPSNPVRGQRLTISTNPSIANLEIRGSIPTVNTTNSMAMGSCIQFLYVQEPNKWFRVG